MIGFKLDILWRLVSLRYLKWRYRNKLYALHQKRWDVLQSNLLRSPFYAELSKKRAPITDYPIMNKSLFMKNFDTINTQAISLQAANEIALNAEKSRDFSAMLGDVSVGLSSGTSGNRSIFLSSITERAGWVAAILDRVIGLSPRSRSVAFFLRANNNLYSAAQSKLIRFEYFDLFEPFDTHIKRLNVLNPTILVAQPSVLLDLAEFVKNGQLTIDPKKIISVAEVLYPEDKKYLEEIFEQDIHQVYQCTEGFLASTCAEGTLHFNEDFLLIEKKYIDENQIRFHPIITDFLRVTQPIIRYELNDIIIEKENCLCGSRHMAIAQIEGRSDDILVFEGKGDKPIKIFPDFFRRAIIMSDPDIIDYTLLQRKSHHLELFVNGGDEQYGAAVAAIQDLLSVNKIHQVNFFKADKRHHEIGFKLRRIINASS